MRNRCRAEVYYPFAMDAKQLLAEALRLSDEERAALAGELIQSLDREVDADAEAAWSDEIRTRLDRLDAGTAKTIPWSEARRRIHAAAGGPRA
jgi:putative addiction module component (TIGR02574 family)